MRKERLSISEEELTQFAERFLQENYGIQLNIPIKRNNRLRTTLGRYVISHHQEPLRIEIAGNTLTYGTKEAIIGILKHECIHFALHMKGVAYKDGQYPFETELKKHGAPSTKTQMIGKYYLFRCVKCKMEGKSKYKQLFQHPKKYRTSCCHAPLTIIGEEVYDGESFYACEV